MKFSPSSNPDHLKAITKPSPAGLVLKSDEELLESLKALPTNINFNSADGELNTILYMSAANNYPKTVAYLLTERHVDPNVKVTDRLTAAHIAAAKGHTNVLKLLINCAGIQLSEKDQYGETALFRAIGNTPRASLLETVKLLIAADPNAVSVANEDGMMPIDLGLARKSPSVVKLLLDKGADVSRR